MKPSHAVRLTLGAEADLEQLYDHVSAHRSPAEADALLDRLLEAVESLESFPERGSVPKELDQLGIHVFSQILVSPYRLIYRVANDTVFVLLIADGRRDVQALLQRRLLTR